MFFFIDANYIKSSSIIVYIFLYLICTGKVICIDRFTVKLTRKMNMIHKIKMTSKNIGQNNKSKVP